ncbi:MAG: fatty acid desaturase [Thermoanaerobaculum sp.]|nr:fatty acid desaturase [Thermoanaerobaculum sp.]
MAQKGHWQRAAAGLLRQLTQELGRETLRRLQQKDPRKHALLALGWLGSGVAGALLAVQEGLPWLWPVGVALLGLFAFNGTVLLHEVLHGLVFPQRRPGWERALALLYSAPCGISPSQFTRWHLDHHAELGDPQADPKRHHLSPKRNLRWVKLLYWTPALFFIYFRAAAREAKNYEAPLRRQMLKERASFTALHLGLAATLVASFGWGVWLRLHALPLFVAFPIWFALNRLGQHYAIDPQDPAQWGTLMVRSPYLWDLLFLFSNYHLEHHYFPGVPAYNLPKLRQALEGFFSRRGMRPRTYRSLLYDWFVRNCPPHANWQEDVLVG